MKAILAISYTLALVLSAVALGNTSGAAGNSLHSALAYLGVFH